MDKAKALEILANYCPDLTLANANNLIADLSAIAEKRELTPREWAESVFSRNDKNTYKIGMIKEVRTRFGLGLKEAKDIVDECYPRANSNFFPPHVYPETRNY